MKLSSRNLISLSNIYPKSFERLLSIAKRSVSLDEDLSHCLDPGFVSKGLIADERIVIDGGNKDQPLVLELYEKPKAKNSILKNDLLGRIREITTLAWEDFGAVVEQWFEWSDLLVLAKSNGEVIGFNACTYEDGDVVVYLASFVLPAYQSNKISKYMQRIAIKKLVTARHPKRFFKPVWFTFRTQNPRVMQRVAKFGVVPSVEGRKPNVQERAIAKGVARRFSPDCEFDEQHFVIKKALESKPDLLAQEKVFYSRCERVNKFCNQHLMYETKVGNLFVCVGKLNWMRQLYFWLKN